VYVVVMGERMLRRRGSRMPMLKWMLELVFERAGWIVCVILSLGLCLGSFSDLCGRWKRTLTSETRSRMVRKGRGRELRCCVGGVRESLVGLCRRGYKLRGLRRSNYRPIRVRSDDKVSHYPYSDLSVKRKVRAYRSDIHPECEASSSAPFEGVVVGIHRQGLTRVVASLVCSSVVHVVGNAYLCENTGVLAHVLQTLLSHCGKLVTKAVPNGRFAELDGKGRRKVPSSHDTKHINVPEAVPILH